MQGPKLGKTIAGFYTLPVDTETFIISEEASSSIPIWFSLCFAFRVMRCLQQQGLNHSVLTVTKSSGQQNQQNQHILQREIDWFDLYSMSWVVQQRCLHIEGAENPVAAQTMKLNAYG